MLWLILTILTWGLIHSLLASMAFKSWIQEKLGAELFRGYRLLYNLFSVISAFPIVWLLTNLPDKNLYTVPEPWNFVMISIQFIAVIFLILGVLQTDALAFVGIRQLFEVRPVFMIKDGFYRYVRHPLYFFGLIFLWLAPTSTLNLFIVRISFSIYLIAGAYYEEKKLMREFGYEYIEYKKGTPMFIPRLF